MQFQQPVQMPQFQMPQFQAPQLPPQFQAPLGNIANTGMGMLGRAVSMSPLGLGIKVIKASMISILIANVIVLLLVTLYASSCALGWKLLTGVLTAANVVALVSVSYGLSQLPI